MTTRHIRSCMHTDEVRRDGSAVPDKWHGAVTCAVWGSDLVMVGEASRWPCTTIVGRHGATYSSHAHPAADASTTMPSYTRAPATLQALDTLGSWRTLSPAAHAARARFGVIGPCPSAETRSGRFSRACMRLMLGGMRPSAERQQPPWLGPRRQLGTHFDDAPSPPTNSLLLCVVLEWGSAFRRFTRAGGDISCRRPLDWLGAPSWRQLGSRGGSSCRRTRSDIVGGRQVGSAWRIRMAGERGWGPSRVGGRAGSGVDELGQGSSLLGPPATGEFRRERGTHPSTQQGRRPPRRSPGAHSTHRSTCSALSGRVRSLSPSHIVRPRQACAGSGMAPAERALPVCGLAQEWEAKAV